MTKDIGMYEMIDTYCYYVCQATGITRSQLYSRKTHSDLVNARQCLYLLLADTTNLSYSEIGRQLRKDHTTIISGVNKARDKRKNNKVFAHLYNTIATMLSKEICNGWHDKHRLYVKLPSSIQRHDLYQ